MFLLELYHRALEAQGSVDIRVACLQAMQYVYAQHADIVGEFMYSQHVAAMLTTARAERHAVLQLLLTLATNYQNVQQLLGTDLLTTLVGLLNKFVISSADSAEVSGAEALTAVTLLHRIAAATAGVRDGVVVSPMPRAKALLSHSQFFTVIIQALLCDDVQVMFGVIKLLDVLIDHNDVVLPSLSQTGMRHCVSDVLT